MARMIPDMNQYLLRLLALMPSDIGYHFWSQQAQKQPLQFPPYLPFCPLVLWYV